MLETARKYLSYYRSQFRGDSLDSSLSDNSSYPDFCALAATDDEVFSRFRSAAEYSEILDHVSSSLGRRYLRCIERDPQLLEAARRVCASDTIGGPTKYLYSGFGEASPTTLRYFKVAGDLSRKFGTLSGLNIVEIGVGYGGQARVLSELFEIETYALVDLPEVLNLSERFLETTGDANRIRFISPQELGPVNADLVISNYAFSELRREVQEKYLDLIVLDAPRGYMTYNRITPPSFKSLTAAELAQRVRGTVTPERPRSYPGNQIVIWNRSNANKAS